MVEQQGSQEAPTVILAKVAMAQASLGMALRQLRRTIRLLHSRGFISDEGAKYFGGSGAFELLDQAAEALISLYDTVDIGSRLVGPKLMNELGKQTGKG